MRKAKDYSLKMQDNQGRIVLIPINGASINEALMSGASFDAAREDVESNAFWKAIDRHQISADAWLVERII